MKRTLHFFIRKLRLSNPWKFKAPLLITIPYLVFLVSFSNGHGSFLPVLASVIIIVGIAGIGYLTNDLGDREKDQAIQKENSANGLSVYKLIILFTLFFLLAIAPWYYLPVNAASLILLVLQFFLFYAYAFKPFRLKERGVLGIITDALYAHALPAGLAAFTFSLVVQKDLINYPILLFSLLLWQLILGIRNICFHQLKDFDADKLSQTNTFVTQVGVDRVSNLVVKVILPLELLAFLAFTTFVSAAFPGFAAFVMLYWCYKFFSEKMRIRSMGYRELSNKFLDDLYTQWLPFAVLMLLCYRSIDFLPLLILHFLLFRSEFKTRVFYYLKPDNLWR